MNFLTALNVWCASGVADVDYSRYPSVALQRDWLTAYLESYKHNTGREVTVTEAEVTQLYIQVCKFSLVSVPLKKGLMLCLTLRHVLRSTSERNTCLKCCFCFVEGTQFYQISSFPQHPCVRRPQEWHSRNGSPSQRYIFPAPSPQKTPASMLTHHCSKFDGLHLSWLEASTGKNERRRPKLFFLWPQFSFFGGSSGAGLSV